MKPYELKQSTLDKMEIEGLIEKIKKLEIEIGIKELQIKTLKKDLSIYEKYSDSINDVYRGSSLVRSNRLI
jgi:hypothetical protein